MTDNQRWQWMVIGSGFFLLVYLLAPILTPFVIAALLAYIGDPLADRLEAWGLRRTLAVVVVFVVLSVFAVLLLMVLLPMLERQILLLVNKLPIYVVRLKEVLLPLLNTLSSDGKPLLDWEGLSANIGDYLKGAGNIAGKTLSYLTKSGLALVGWVANLVLIPVVAFYLLRDWDRLVMAVRELLPRRIEPIINRLARECDEVLGAFLRGQMMVMLALGSIYSTGLWIVGLDLALLVGMIAGLVSFVPYLGFIIGIIIAGVLSVIQFHDLSHLLAVAGVFAVGQAIEGMLLTPLLVGERIGLHPVAVIFAVLAGGQLFGFIGILLALPLAAVIAVWLRFVRQHYISSALYGAAASQADNTQDK